jgi:hypothetical protein
MRGRHAAVEARDDHDVAGDRADGRAHGVGVRCHAPRGLVGRLPGGADR